jgi:putative FmdB family regulatory protein
MPKYDWLCKECEQITVVSRSMKDYKVPPEKCEHCENTEGLEKQISSGTSFNLEGTGWFRDGY